MALALTLLSIALRYLSPGEVLPGLAPYHLQQFILGGALAVSIFVMGRSGEGLKTTQTMLVLGFWFAVVASMLSLGWLRAGMNAFVAFLPTFCVYALVCITAYSVPRIRALGKMMGFCAIIMAVEGILAYASGLQGDRLLTGGRVRAYGILNDPNDFAQFLLVALAFLGLSWRKHNPIANMIFVVMPGSVLLIGIFLTGSRGAIFGLAMIVFVVLSKKVSKGSAIVIAVVVCGILVAGKFGGGRDISLHEGSAAGRVVAWGSGIAQLRSKPVFGVGYGQFTEYNDLTAHNSFVLCFAELGFFGYFFWLALLVVSVVGLERLNKLPPPKTPEEIDYARCVTVVRSALYAELITNWFLSRTYDDTLFILIALSSVVIFMKKDAIPTPVVAASRWVPVTLLTLVGSVLVIYATIRIRSF